MVGAGKVGLAMVPCGALDGDGADQARVLRNVTEGLAVEQDRAHRQPDRAIDRAFERHVDGTVVALPRGALEVHHHLAAPDGDGHGDLEVAPVGVVEEAVHMPFGPVGAVGQSLDRLAHEPLGVVHERIGRSLHDFEPVALDQREVALGADSARRNLRLHVAHHHVRRADVVAHHVPERLVLDALVVGLERLELQALGVGVHGIDDAAASGAERADVEVMRGGDGVAHQRLIEEDRHDEGDVRPVARAVVGGVVDDDVALVQRLAALLQDLVHPPHVAGDRPRLERCRVHRFAELAAVAVDDRSAEIFGLRG